MCLVVVIVFGDIISHIVQCRHLAIDIVSSAEIKTVCLYELLETPWIIRLNNMFIKKIRFYSFISISTLYICDLFGSWYGATQLDNYVKTTPLIVSLILTFL